jgi:carboxypeptidase Q
VIAPSRSVASVFACAFLALLGTAGQARAQAIASADPVIRAIWDEGTRNSQLERLGQALMDSVGPRLTGSPGQQAAHDWAVRTYQGWGIDARNEQYGTWRGWRRGIDHIHLIAPRVQSLEGMLLAWSPGTAGRDVEAPVRLLPDVADAAAFRAWLPQARGHWILTSFPEPTCRPDEIWQQFATPMTFAAMQQQRDDARRDWNARLQRTGLNAVDLARTLEQAGAAGIITLNWSGGYGVRRVFNARTERIPTFDLGCEDYGMVARLAANGQGPVIRAFADAEFTGETPVFNTIAEIRGSQLPDEYVVLSAHFDSWDGATGATDNGTGTITMMEAMRILRTVHPAPRRTILVGHWSGEEQGLNGSRAFAADNPRVLQGLQALLNQDNGTGRVSVISMMGFIEAGGHFGRWLAHVPAAITQHINLELPGIPAAGGSDHAAVICHGAPGFRLGSLEWDYRNYTWHTNRDTYDKIVFDEVRNNAILTAMLAYLAAQDDTRVPRQQRVMPEGLTWPACPQPARSWEQSDRVR